MDENQELAEKMAEWEKMTRKQLLQTLYRMECENRSLLHDVQHYAQIAMAYQHRYETPPSVYTLDGTIE